MTRQVETLGKCYYCKKPAISLFHGKMLCSRCWRVIKLKGVDYLKEKLESIKRRYEKYGIIQKE